MFTAPQHIDQHHTFTLLFVIPLTPPSPPYSPPSHPPHPAIPHDRPPMCLTILSDLKAVIRLSMHPLLLCSAPVGIVLGVVCVLCVCVLVLGANSNLLLIRNTTRSHPWPYTLSPSVSPSPCLHTSTISFYLLLPLSTSFYLLLPPFTSFEIIIIYETDFIYFECWKMDIQIIDLDPLIVFIRDNYQSIFYTREL